MSRPLDVVNDPVFFKVWWKSRTFEVWENDALIVSAGIGLGLLWRGVTQKGELGWTPEAQRRDSDAFRNQALRYLQAEVEVEVRAGRAAREAGKKL